MGRVESGDLVFLSTIVKPGNRCAYCWNQMYGLQAHDLED
jgi:hypothetical protein